MEAEDGFDLSAKKTAMTAWRGDWASYKRQLKAIGILNDVRDALKLGETTASKERVPMEDLKDELGKWDEKMVQQSERLGALLLLSLDSTKGPQQSLVVNRSAGMEDNGVLMWADLVRHFERSSKEVRVSVLQKDWEQNTLAAGEHQNELYGRLVATNSKLKGLGVGYTDEQLKMRFVAAIEGQDSDDTYINAIQQYRGTQIEGKGWSLKKLLEYLNHIYDTRRTTTAEKPEIKGLIANTVTCDHCKKVGHTVNECWTRGPRKAPRSKPFRHPRDERASSRNLECWRCGKRGHKKDQCRTRKETNAGIAAVANQANDIYHSPTYVDTACSEHLVKDMSLLKEAINIQHERKTMRLAGGIIMTLTHKGSRTIKTPDGPLTLKETYYAQAGEYNLISVPKLAEKGVEAKFTQHSAYIQKNETTIHLEKRDGLWSIPEIREGTVASLRME